MSSVLANRSDVVPPAEHGRVARLMAARSDAVIAGPQEIDGRPVMWFHIEGGAHAGAVRKAAGEAIERSVRLAIDMGVPIVGLLSTSGADVHEGVASLHAWGRIARVLSEASGIVPTILAAVGPCVSGPAFLLGLADHVIMTNDAFAFIGSPASVMAITGVEVDADKLGGARVHDMKTGVASLLVESDADALDAAALILDYLPSNHLQDAPLAPCNDPIDRQCVLAAAAVPDKPTAPYDVRVVIEDALDEESFLELRDHYAPNMVTGLGRLEGRSVGIIANQPMQRAGTLDIEASRKAARFVQWCDSFNLPIITFVDTPGFEPGKDLEWRGMIRHGAELVHAYAAATVPRICLILRKSYGGAYIVMDSKTLANDYCIAWPGAEIAVMGAPGAVQILHGKRLRGIDDAQARKAEELLLAAEYEDRFCNPYVAATQGFVDNVIAPVETREALVRGLRQLSTKRDHQPGRRHAVSPV